MQPFTPPEFGAPLPAARPSAEAIELLRYRRSTPADLMTGPGPDEEALMSILQIAARVPDHRRVNPYRFIIFRGDARAEAGEIIERAFRTNEPQADQNRLAAERGRFLRAPTVVAVVFSADTAHKTPEWEQILTTGAVCENMLIAASAHGIAAQWITEWYAYDRAVLSAFGLGPEERIAGFIYLGTAREEPKERLRPSLSALMSRFGEERAKL